MGYALSLDMLPRYTYDDYCQWTDRWELIDGVPYAMSPLPTVRHQRISMKLAALLDRELGSCQHCHASLPIDWKIAEDTVVQPDVLVACFPIIDSKFIERAPTLVVEVLSPSTRSKDLTIKRGIYLDQRVKYYVIIDPDTEQYTVLQLQGDDYAEVAQGRDGHFTFAFDTDCQASIDFALIWA